MPFKKGRSGNPEGLRRGKPARDAMLLEVALAERAEPCPAPEGSLRYAARQLLIRASTDTAAFKEVADRLDGKPVQQSEFTVKTATASQIGDDELANIAIGSGEGASEASVDPKELN